MPSLCYCVPIKWLCEQTERIPRCTGRKPFLSSEYPEIRLWILPLEKFLAFARDKIPVFYDTWDTFFFLPSNLLGYPREIAKSGDSGSVWKVFTLWQRDSLMAWFKRSSDSHSCAVYFGCIFLLCQKPRQAVLLISFRHFAVLFFLDLNSICSLLLPKILPCNWSKPTHFWGSWAGFVAVLLWRACRIRSPVLLTKGMLHSCVPINPPQCWGACGGGKQGRHD